MADLKDQIHDNAKQPRRATVDGNSAEQHPIKDQIEADRYVNASNAIQNQRRGLRLNKFVPPGTS